MFDQYFDMPDALQRAHDFVMVIFILITIFNFIEAFFGYKAWRFILTVYGLFIGGAIGVGVGVWLGLEANNFEDFVGTIGLGALMGACIGAVLMGAIRPFGTFVYGGLFVLGAGSLALTYGGQIPRFDSIEAVIAIAAALFVGGGLVLVGLDRPGIVIASAIVGSLGLVANLTTLGVYFGAVELSAFDPPEIIFGLVAIAAMLAMLVQFASTSPTGTASQDPKASLAQIEQMYKENQITDAEYQRQRERILESL